MAKQIDSTNLGYLLGKIKSAFWRKSETSELTIDNTPTANSDNLVKSGGVYSAVNGKLSKDGGTMATDATLTFEDTDVLNNTVIEPGTITLNDFDDGDYGVEVDAATPGVKAFIGTGYYTEYGIRQISVKDTSDNNTEHIITIPNVTGTLALTSDIPNTNNFIQKSGGSMSTGAGLGFSSTGDEYVSIDATGVEIADTNNDTTYCAGSIVNGSYTQTLPSKSGTFAMTSDIPTVNNSTITIQKGGSNVDSFTTNASSNKSINIPNELPSYSSSNNGQILSVVNGSLAWVTPAQIYSGSATPSNSTGNNGDIYVQS